MKLKTDEKGALIFGTEGQKTFSHMDSATHKALK